jgi:hypothetical protein
VPSLADVVGRGREAHRRTLMLWREPLARALQLLAQQEGNQQGTESARSLAAAFTEGSLPASINWPESRLIERALPFVESAPVPTASPSPPAALPLSENEPIMQDEPNEPPGQWLDNLPGNPTALVDLVGESGRNAD